MLNRILHKRERLLPIGTVIASYGLVLLLLLVRYAATLLHGIFLGALVADLVLCLYLWHLCRVLGGALAVIGGIAILSGAVLLLAGQGIGGMMLLAGAGLLLGGIGTLRRNRAQALEEAIIEEVKALEPVQVAPVCERSAARVAAPVDLEPLKQQLRWMQYRQNPAFEPQIKVLEKRLGKALLNRDELIVMRCAFRGAEPVYLGSDSQMNVFTAMETAEDAQEYFLEEFHTETKLQTLQGPAEIRAYFDACLRDGIQVTRVDNGSSTMCRLRLENFLDTRAESLIGLKNRRVRGALRQSKQHDLQLGYFPERERGWRMWNEVNNAMMAARLEGYRAMGQGPLYVLALPVDESVSWYTWDALELARGWLLEADVQAAGYTEQALLAPGTECTAVYCGGRNFCYVNRYGQGNDVETGYVCVFTDYAEAMQVGKRFAASGMPCGIVAVTLEDLLEQAEQCAGFVVDIDSLSYEVPKDEFKAMRSAVARAAEERQKALEAQEAAKKKAAADLVRVLARIQEKKQQERF